MDIAGLISKILEVVLFVAGFFIKKANLNLEAKKRFYEFLEAASEDQNMSAKVKDEAKHQLEIIREKMKLDQK